MWDPKGLASLRAKVGPARIEFDLAKVALSLAEKNRVITNLALLAVGVTEPVFSATLKAQGAGIQSAFGLTRGIALSNAGPLLGAAAPLPLNAMVSLPLDQAFVLEIDRTGVGEELHAVQDVVLWVEYSADL
jgi:hypothetical protein